MSLPIRAALGVAALALATSTTLEAGPAPTVVRRLDGSQITEAALTGRIEEVVRKARVHGLAVAVFNDREPVYAHAFGVKRTDTQEPLGLDTVFYGASLSKAVFSVLVMRLVEEGVLALDTPLVSYLDQPIGSYVASSASAWHEDLRDLADDPRHKRITARMCLDHTAGFPNWRSYESDKKLRIKSEPGARYSYSGEGLTFLQVVLERRTRRPLEDLAREKVFVPYGMTSSSYRWQARFEANFCNGHDESGQVLPKDKDNAPRSASTLETTARDYARFLRAVLQHQGLEDSSWKELFATQVRIRSKAQFGPLAAEDGPQNDAIQLGYGLGWGVFSTPHGRAAFKEGHGDGFQHYSILFPERGLGVLLMTNSANGESAYKELLELTIGDTHVPWQWENYLPYEQAGAR